MTGGGRKTVIAILLTLGRQVAASAFNLLTIIIIARALGPEGAGMFAVALLLPAMLTQILNLGLAPANVYFISSGRASLALAWAASRNLGSAMAVLGMAIGLSVIIYGAGILMPGVDRTHLLIALASFPFMLINAICLSLFQAKQDFVNFNRIFMLQPFIGLVGIAAFANAERLTLGTALASNLAGHATATLVGLLAVRRMTPFGVGEHGKAAFLKTALSYGIKVHVNENVAFVNRRLDLFVVNFFVGLEASGLFAVASRIAEQLWLLSTAVATVLFPKLSSFGADGASRAALTEVMSRTVLWITLLAAGLLAAVAAPLLNTFFGPEFGPARIIILILLPGVVIRSVSRILANDFASRGLAGVNLMLGLMVLGINLILNVIFVPHFGAAGAAMATSAAYLSMAIMRLAFQEGLTELRWWRAIVPMPSDFATIRRLSRRRRKKQEAG